MKTKFLGALLVGLLCILGMVSAYAADPFTMATSTSEYRLSKYDVLNIVIVGFSDAYFSSSSVLPDPNTSAKTAGETNQAKLPNGFNDVIIGPDGKVNLPYAGAVKLAGLTIPEATAILTEKLGEYIKIPSMTIVVKQFGPRKVYVMGEVKKPGMYSLSSDYMNVFAALSSAEGITKRGRPKHVTVARVIDGKVFTKEVDIERFIQAKDISQNIALVDGDVVFVPRSNKVDLSEDLLPILTMISITR